MATTNYSFATPTVGASLNTWGADLNGNTEKVDDLLGGDVPITGIDINSGSIDGTPIGANAASTGAFTTISATGAISGNASTASALASAVDISLTGDVTGTVSFDGSASVSITATVVDDSHSHTIGNVDYLQSALDQKLAIADYTAADILTKIKTVDGTGSGLDADLFQGAAASDFVKDSDYTTSAVSNGYVTLPNGLMVQWGSTTVSGNQTNKATSFPTSFPTACFQVIATSVVSSASEGDNWGLGSTSPTTSTYYLTNGNGNSRLFRFIAIGH